MIYPSTFVLYRGIDGQIRRRIFKRKIVRFEPCYSYQGKFNTTRNYLFMKTDERAFITIFEDRKAHSFIRFFLKSVLFMGKFYLGVTELFSGLFLSNYRDDLKDLFLF